MFQKNGEGIKYIVAGLGNPGDKYTFTKHNAGFLALDFISQTLKFKIDRIKFRAFTGRGTFVSEQGEKFDVLFMKPQTYMNSSGESVAEAARFYKIPPERIIVIFDDIALPVGKTRIKRTGSDGGHNGIKSIIQHLRTQDFPRIKIGVGDKPHPEYELADWVLSGFTKEEQQVIFDTFPKVKAALEEMLTTGNADSAMNKYNG